MKNQDETIFDSIKASLDLFLHLTERNVDRVDAELENFLSEIKPNVYELLAQAATGRAVAVESLQLLSDAAAARVTRTALSFTHDQRMAIVAIVVAVIRGSLSLAKLV